MKNFLRCQSLKTIPTPLETIEQQNFVKYARFWLRLKGLDQLLFAIPNEGFRDAKNRCRMIAEGLVSGVPDLCLAIPVGKYHGLYIEMKRQKQSKVTDDQEFMIKLLKSQGYRVEVCKGYDSAKAVFDDYMKETGLFERNP